MNIFHHSHHQQQQQQQNTEQINSTTATPSIEPISSPHLSSTSKKGQSYFYPHKNNNQSLNEKNLNLHMITIKIL
eukprot:UN10574